MMAEARLDYPESGPADIYDLGVPKAAKLVNRVPTHEITQILETVRAGRQHMDDYRAIVVNRTAESGRPDGRPAEVIYRKQDKFRRDNALWLEPSIVNDPKIVWPMGEEAAGEWWNQCVEDHCFLVLVSIDHGSTSYHINIDWAIDPDGTAHVQVAGVEKREDRGIPGEIYPGLWSEMPEFACRPPMGIQNRIWTLFLIPAQRKDRPAQFSYTSDTSVESDLR